MDATGFLWYFPAMRRDPSPIPSWQLYGEDSPFPDILHIERIVDRAEGLHWHIAPHRHLHLHQVFLILSGQVRLTVDGHEARATPPVVMNIPRGTVHGFDFAPGTDGFVLTLPVSGFPDLFGTAQGALAPLGRAFVAGAAPGLETAFAALAAEHRGTGPLRVLRLRAGAIALCCSVTESAPVAADGGLAGDPRITAFESLIRDHLDQNRRLADFARALKVSERHLRRLCLQVTGQSAQATIDMIRLREACRLLAYTRMQVQEVGYALGYDDPAYFARAFRRRTGLSPSDYRARLEGQGLFAGG